MKKKFKVIFVPYGIANRYSGRIIEVHEKLLDTKYRALLYEIVKHEMSHSDSGYSRKDFFLDISGFKNRKQYWNFILTTPSSWWQFLPLYKSRGRFFWDWSVFLLWLFVMIFSMLFVKWVLFLWT